MIEAYSVGASSQTKWPASTIARRLLGSLVEKLSVDERDDWIVAAVDYRDRSRNLRQQLSKHRQLLGIPADVLHRLGEAVSVISSGTPPEILSTAAPTITRA